MFGRGKNVTVAHRTWANVSAPAPYLSIYAQRTDWRREVDPVVIHKDWNYQFPNMTGSRAGQPAGQLYPTALPGVTNPGTFYMQNVRRYTPNGSMSSSGAGLPFASNNLQANSMGSHQAAVPPGSIKGVIGGASPWGVA